MTFLEWLSPAFIYLPLIQQFLPSFSSLPFPFALHSLSSPLLSPHPFIFTYLLAAMVPAIVMVSCNSPMFLKHPSLPTVPSRHLSFLYLFITPYLSLEKTDDCWVTWIYITVSDSSVSNQCVARLQFLDIQTCLSSYLIFSSLFSFLLPFRVQPKFDWYFQLNVYIVKCGYVLSCISQFCIMRV